MAASLGEESELKVKEETPSDNPSEETIAKALAYVNERIVVRHQKLLLKNSKSRRPRLVAVTKTKPVEMILHAYEKGQRHFGENYVQELVEKSKHPLLAQLDICWHFIGHLQRNKCSNLLACPHLWAVESVDSERLASALNASWDRRGTGQKLKVFIQINTSGETSKHGNSSDGAALLVKHILDHCNCLKFMGLMAIGRVGHDYSTGPNPDFECLVETRKRICEELSLELDEVELSMGMSSDFEQAIDAGSTNVRVGSVLFGARQPK